MPAYAWETLEAGLTYQSISIGEQKATGHLLRVDLSSHRLDILRAADQGKRRKFISGLIAGHKVQAAINASFFTSDGSAMGLLVKAGQRIRPLRQAAWGVFQIMAGRPSIVHTRDYQENSRPELAVQAGPRLLIDGWIPPFKDQTPARRSGICVTASGQVILAVVSPLPITLHQFAEMLRPHCQTALNLDGGASTQFYLKGGGKEIGVPGLEPVPNVLVVRASY